MKPAWSNWHRVIKPKLNPFPHFTKRKFSHLESPGLLHWSPYFFCTVFTVIRIAGAGERHRPLRILHLFCGCCRWLPHSYNKTVQEGNKRNVSHWYENWIVQNYTGNLQRLKRTELTNVIVEAVRAHSDQQLDIVKEERQQWPEVKVNQAKHASKGMNNFIKKNVINVRETVIWAVSDDDGIID